MMWDSFQTSSIIAENLHFLCFWNPSCVRRSVPVYACFGSRSQAVTHVRGPMATLVILFQKIDFCSFKMLYFPFNTPQVNLISDWALNWHWTLEFRYHWGTGAWVVRGTKFGVYTSLKNIRAIGKRSEIQWSLTDRRIGSTNWKSQ